MWLLYKLLYFALILNLQSCKRTPVIGQLHKPIILSIHVQYTRMDSSRLRPGSDAVLHMSRIELEFRPTQINLDRKYSLLESIKST